ncbi:hypothetical protein KIN20_009224 [Parelaphostrongylus tenuis]|uniref:J domain-containing protein n=1 Tax=Parelaphostrongylus tenuis TaxID=148309 RepID=A0AAD5M611_PARTN|nr:hypothetical protein KIN20_009224 [Parelaphostrongylus tenuis]
MLFMARRCATVLSRRGVSYLPKKLNYYEILGVKSNASLEEIKAAFAKKSAELHPDRKSKTQDSRVGWSRSSDTELFMEVKEAYDCLRNPKKRAAYDDQIVSSNGYLREATHLKFKKDTIVDLNRARDAVYGGPRSGNSFGGCHFRDPEKEFHQRETDGSYVICLTSRGCFCCTDEYRLHPVLEA